MQRRGQGLFDRTNLLASIRNLIRDIIETELYPKVCSRKFPSNYDQWQLTFSGEINLESDFDDFFFFFFFFFFLCACVCELFDAGLNYLCLIC